MPELPEVEVTRLGLLPVLVGRRITKVSRSGKRLRAESPPQLLRRCLLGRTVLDIDRRAKYLLFRLSGGTSLVIHLGMSGKLGLLPANTLRARHDHLCLALDNGMEIRLNDARRFGSVLAWPAAEARQLEEAFTARLGVEPLGRDLDADYLLGQGMTRTQPVKVMLMDAGVVVGIGNIYANEILFAAGLHPLTPASRVSKAQWQKIAAASRRILTQAICAGGSTIADFLGASGNPGYFQLQFTVYKRLGQPCRKCSQAIVRTIVGGRATYFCPACQQPSS